MAEPRRVQAVGFAVRRELAPFITRNPDVSDIGAAGPAPSRRDGVDITINLGVPLRLLAVHLTSGCTDAGPQVSPICASLFAQGGALADWAATRKREHEAFAIIGDFNRHFAPGDAFFRVCCQQTIPTP